MAVGLNEPTLRRVMAHCLRVEVHPCSSDEGFLEGSPCSCEVRLVPRGIVTLCVVSLPLFLLLVLCSLCNVWSLFVLLVFAFVAYSLANCDMALPTMGELDGSVTVAGPEGEDEPVKVNKFGENFGVFRATFEPPKSGRYTVLATLPDFFGSRARAHCKSEVQLIVQDRPFVNDIDPNASTLALPAEVCPGKRCTAVLRCMGADGQPFALSKADVSAHASRPDGKAVAVAVAVGKIDSEFELSLTPQEEGVHSLDVKLKGKKMKGSPFALKATHPTPQPEAKGEVLTSGAIRGGANCVTVRALAKDGSIIPLTEADLCADLSDGSSKVPFEFETVEPGVFTITFTPEQLGQLTLAVALRGTPAAGSPYTLNVADPAADHTKCVVHWPAADHFVPGVPQEFTVELRDSAGDLVRGGQASMRPTVKPEGSEHRVHVDITPTDTQGIYRCKFTPKREAEHKLRVLVNKHNVPTSPIARPCSFQISETVVETFGDATKGEEYSFHVTLLDKARNKVAPPAKELTVSFAYGDTTVPVTPTVEPERGEHSFLVKFVPPDAGEGILRATYRGVASEPVQLTVADIIDIEDEPYHYEFPAAVRSFYLSVKWYGKNNATVDMDLSCVTARYFLKLDHVFVRVHSSLDGAIKYMGDTGGKATVNEERVLTRFDHMHPLVNELIYVATSESGVTWGEVERVTVAVVDAHGNGAVLFERDIAQPDAKTALFMCKVFKYTPTVWRMRVLGIGEDATQFPDLLTRQKIGRHMTKAPPLRKVTVKVFDTRALTLDHISQTAESHEKANLRGTLMSSARHTLLGSWGASGSSGSVEAAVKKSKKDKDEAEALSSSRKGTGTARGPASPRSPRTTELMESLAWDIRYDAAVDRTDKKPAGDTSSWEGQVVSATGCGMFAEMNLFGFPNKLADSGSEKEFVGRVVLPLPLEWKKPRLGWYKIMYTDKDNVSHVCGEVKMTVDVSEEGTDDPTANEKRYKRDTSHLAKSVSVKGLGRMLGFGKKK